MSSARTVRVVALAAAACSACGRVGFTEVTDVGPGSACIAATEVCNGIDDDCDGQIDEGCPCTPFSVTISSGPAGPLVRDLAWTGAYYIVADTVTGLLDEVDNTGSVIGMMPFAFDRSDDLVFWDGVAPIFVHGSIGAPTGSIDLSHVAPDGSTTLFASVPVDALVDYVARREHDGEIELAWVAGNEAVADVVVMELAPDGTVRVPAVTVATAVVGAGVHAVARSSVLAVSWSSSSPFASTVSTIGGAAPIVDTVTSSEDLVGAAAGFLRAPFDGMVTVFALDPDGDPIGQPLLLEPVGLNAIGARVATRTSGYVAAIAYFTTTTVGLDVALVDPTATTFSISPQYSIPGQSLDPPLVWVDAERTGILFSAGSGSFTQQLIQTCP